MCDINRTRAVAGKATTIEYNGKKVDKQKLRRHLKTSMRRDNSVRTSVARERNNLGMLSGPALLLGNSV